MLFEQRKIWIIRANSDIYVNSYFYEYDWEDGT